MKKLFTLFTMVCLTVLTFGATRTSTGTNWNTASHWSGNQVPTFSDDVIINTAMSMNTSTSAVSNDVTINSGKSLTVNATSDLTFKGTFTNNGSFTCAGDLSFTGTTSEDLDGNDFSTKTFTINGTGGILNIKNNFSVEGCVYLKSGTIETNGTGGTFILDEDVSGAKKGRICEATGGIINGDYVANFVLFINTPASTSTTAGWSYMGAPNNGTILSNWNIYTTGFTGANAPSYPFFSIYTYDNSVIVGGGSNTDGWIPASNITNTTDIGQGMIIYEATQGSSGGGKLQTLIGNVDYVNNTQIQLMSNGAHSAPLGGWNLLSNPFSGVYELDGLSWTATGCQCNTQGDGSIFVRDTDNNSYIAYNYYIGTSTGGLTHLAEGQAFFLRATNGATDGQFLMPPSGIDDSHKYMNQKTSIYDEYVEVQITDGGTGITNYATLAFVDNNFPTTLYPGQDNGVYDTPMMFIEGSTEPLVCFGFMSGNSVDEDYAIKSSTITSTYQTAYIEIHEDLWNDVNGTGWTMMIRNRHDNDNILEVFDNDSDEWARVEFGGSHLVTEQNWLVNPSQSDDGKMVTMIAIRFAKDPDYNGDID